MFFSSLMASSQSALSEDMYYLTKPSGQNILSVATISNPHPSHACASVQPPQVYSIITWVYKADPTHYKRTISPTAVWPPNQAPLTPPPHPNPVVLFCIWYLCSCIEPTYQKQIRACSQVTKCLIIR